MVRLVTKKATWVVKNTLKTHRKWRLTKRRHQMCEAFTGGFSTFVKTLTYVFFSYGDIELVAVAAGESAQGLVKKLLF